MNERFLIGVVGIIGFLLVAFTSIVPVQLHSYGITNIFIVKGVIGVLSLFCAYMVVWGFLKKEGSVKPKKEGRIHLRPLVLILGIAFVMLAWFTDVPLWLADYTGLSQTLDYGGAVLQGGIGTRIFVSLLTGLGVLLCRFSWYRRNDDQDYDFIDGMTYATMMDTKSDGKGGVR